MEMDPHGNKQITGIGVKTKEAGGQDELTSQGGGQEELTSRGGQDELISRDSGWVMTWSMTIQSLEST